MSYAEFGVYASLIDMGMRLGGTAELQGEEGEANDGGGDDDGRGEDEEVGAAGAGAGARTVEDGVVFSVESGQAVVIMPKLRAGMPPTSIACE